MDAANIVDVVSEYVTLRRAGASYKGLCPFHDDKTPSFYVNPARGICKCFACGKGGNAVHFIMEQEQLNYVEALRLLAKKYGIEIKEHQQTDEERRSQSERESMLAVNEWASHYFHQTLLETEDGRAIGQAYFRSRGFRDDIIQRFRLGYSPDTWNAMSKTAVQKAYNPDYLVKIGLSIRRNDGTLIDKYRGRVIFPWFAVNGEVVAFGGRKLDARTKGVEQKYINSPESDIFHKSNELYGIFQAKKQMVKEDLVYMVEGYTDVISMHQCGIENVVANSGTALNPAQIRLLHRFTSNITLIYDSDEAGIHAALRGTDMLLAEGMNVKVLLLPEGDDPDSFARNHNATEFQQYVKSHQTDAILFKVSLLLKEAGNDPRKRSELATSILQSICVIPDPIVRSSYLHECSEQMKMDEQMLLRQCNKMRSNWVAAQKTEREREQQRQKRLNQQEAPTSSSEKTESQESRADGQENSTLMIYTSLTPSSERPGEVPLTLPLEQQKVPVEVSRFTALERLIMTLIVRYGEQTIEGLDQNGKKQSITVVEYVAQELSVDGLTFHSLLYAQMLTEACGYIRQPGFQCSRYFVTNPDINISREASDLLSDRYQLSQGQQMPTEREMLPAYIVHLMLDYKYQVVHEELEKVTKQLADPTLAADSDKMREVLQQHVQLTGVLRKLGERLGERVVMK